MRKKIIAGNWKMNKDINESIGLSAEVKNGLAAAPLCEVVICPTFIALDSVRAIIIDSPIQLGAQNMHFEDSGAFTGEVSGKMIKSAGCQFVILGHSERRTIFKESDQLINKKIKKAIAEDLRPIFCIGETLEERENNSTFDIIRCQVIEGLKDISAGDMKTVVIAYEPVWAIGTGKTATPAQAQEVHAFIRALLKELYNENVAESTVIQYGGSVKADNAYELLHQQDIDGALVGGACLDAASFLKIIASA